MIERALSPVLQPIAIGDFHLKNRVVMASLTRSRSSEEGVPPQYAAHYYAQRAGAGLIVTEARNISPQARGYAFSRAFGLLARAVPPRQHQPADR
ncbi:MAG: hypothetical protein JO347_05435 [Candidatus Eremiobacteraeota bacterium]|nr:hypothetical protein [Candidatus Eremiobacteraeota bacterium]